MRRLALVSILLPLACATGGVAAWRPDPGVGAVAPAAGAALEGVVAGLYAAGAGEGDSVEIEELRVLDLDERPWRELGPDDASAGTLGLVAHRICRRRDGFEFVRQERASWMIFRSKALVAYDHGEFGPGCSVSRSLRPAPPELVTVERGLLRYVAQRYPAGRPSLEERLRGGLVLVEVGRLDDAKRVLDLAGPRIDELKDQLQGIVGEEREVGDVRLAELGVLQGRLHQALRVARKREKAALEAAAEAQAGASVPGD